MITLYRILSDDDATLVNLQGEETDRRALESLLGLQLRLTTRTNTYEQEYYCYIRGSNRSDLERKALEYLQSNYTPPAVQMLMFEGKQAFPDDRPANHWPHLLATRIQQFFAQEHHRIICSGGLGNEVFLAEPVELTPGLRLYKGVSYRLTIRPDYVPLLQTDIAFHYEMDGESISRTKAYRCFAGQPDVLAAMHEHESQTTDTIFNLSQRFVRGLSYIGDEFSFNDSPLSTDELNWQTWLWAHENPVTLEVSDGQEVHVTTEMLKSDLALFSPPDPFQLIILYPQDDGVNLVPSLNGKGFVRQLRHILQDALNDRETPVDYVGYTLGQSNGPVVEECRQKTERYPDRNTLYLMIAPPEGSRYADDPHLAAVDEQAFDLMKAVRRLGTHDYLITLTWDGLTDYNERFYIIESALLKGLDVLGATPWRIQNIPYRNGCTADDVCFIGLDVKTGGPPIAGGVIIDGYGVLRGYHAAGLKNPMGDLIDEKTLTQMVVRLLDYFCDVTGRQPAHIIVHRDGLYQAGEAEHLQYLLAELGMSYDLVEVRKSGAPRLRQSGNLFGTPSKDIAVGSESEHVAYLSNTLSVRQEIDGNWIFPATDSIGVYRKVGSSEMKVLAAQVHALSRAHISAIRRTERLPVTTAYADSLVSHVSFRADGPSDFGKAIGIDAQPFWL